LTPYDGRVLGPAIEGSTAPITRGCCCRAGFVPPGSRLGVVLQLVVHQGYCCRAPASPRGTRVAGRRHLPTVV